MIGAALACCDLLVDLGDDVALIFGGAPSR